MSAAARSFPLSETGDSKRLPDKQPFFLYSKAVLPKVIAIVGPTASGKSSLSIWLAKKLNGEIISADSRQVYKGMRVISRAERGYMVGIVNPKKIYSVGEYQQDAKEICSSILQNTRIPIVVGGAGLYADAFLRGWQLPKVAPDKKLRATLAKKSPTQLFALLKKLDSASAERIERHNPVRLVRAIEIAKTLGTVPSLVREPPYNTLWLGLKKSKNIRAGVEARLKAGMIAEAKKLRAYISKKRFSELGFEFSLLADYIDKKITKKQLIDSVITGEEEYAKRQMRWFKRNKDIRWINSKQQALKLSKQFLSGR